MSIGMDIYVTVEVQVQRFILLYSLSLIKRFIFNFGRGTFTYMLDGKFRMQGMNTFFLLINNVLSWKENSQWKIFKSRSYKKAPGKAIPLKDCSTYQLFNAGALRSFAMTHHGGIYNNQGHSKTKTKMTKSGCMDDVMVMEVMLISWWWWWWWCWWW